MAWRNTLLAALTFGTADALRTSFSINDLQAIADDSAALESRYSLVSSLAGQLQPDQAADTNPSLLYPAYNLTVPIDHFHNDSMYEPHVSAPSNFFCHSRPCFIVFLLAQRNLISRDLI